MKKCLIYGNCQIKPLREILQSNTNFQNQYQFIELEPVHLLDKSDVADLEAKIFQTDLFIHQLVSDNYQEIEQFGTNYLRKNLPSSSKVIAIPGAYFTGYHPAIISFKNEEGNKSNEPCDYHDVNLLYLFDRGKTVNETISLIQQANFYQPQYVINNVINTLNELRRREVELDITISDFIEKNYRRQKLFHTINHPGNTVLNYLANSILKLLDLPPNSQEFQSEILDFTRFPIYPSVAQALKLNFDFDSEYCIQGEILNLQQTVELFFNFYNDNQELVKLNILQNQDKYAITVCGIQVSSAQAFQSQILDGQHNDLEDSEHLLEYIREQTFADLLDLAEQHCKNNLYQEAITLCQAALKIEENSVEGWRQLAYFYEAQGNIQSAIAASDRAMEIDPQQADSTIHQARLLESQGDYSAAKELYQEAIALDEDQPPWVYRHLGNVLLEEDNSTDAIIAYQKAIALNPDFGSQIYLSLADAYRQEKQWQQAKNSYDQALKINPGLQNQVENEIQTLPELRGSNK
ncbi:tetratricopeptide repeat protein [Xenococcus sp. PCC 7305]|uniref:WcbI family polysaccharide biosynthesis putative acetyltransferase n=1 Tax=Xenococcus sp. PCC 7305 TaxID=102125 RepID=UPI0002ABECC9|nr:WcbI family polysaccharide biosynthesis putative acetyltransferase [Xenococcus sp. PCC 7305]ELS03187.1 tetratricopeptide repeat protein [Xenococcus sp. PCC 7305]